MVQYAMSNSGDTPDKLKRMQIKGAPRSNAAAKDSEWVRERRTLEADQPADVNEIVLINPGADPTLCSTFCTGRVDSLVSLIY